jgi:NSS family neurotransmitter:Na+ symporter
LRYDTFLADPVRMSAYLFGFLGVTALIVARGVANGIEMASIVLMPLLILLLVALAWYSATRGDLPAALDFLFTPDWDGVTANVALEAIGLGFFSIGVGLGMMITYAAYAQPHIKLGRIALISIVADTVISIIAGIAVFPIVFAHALDPAGGAGLVFVTLPVAFAAMPAGQWAATAFFAMLVIAALGSAVAMLEVVTTVLMQWRGWQRGRACLVGVTACAATAIPTVLSFNLLSDWHPLGGVSGFESATFFDLLDFATSNLMLPLGGLLVAVFAAWLMRPGFLQDALSLQHRSAWLLRIVLRFVVPVVLVAVVIARFGA